MIISVTGRTASQPTQLSCTGYLNNNWKERLFWQSVSNYIFIHSIEEVTEWLPWVTVCILKLFSLLPVFCSKLCCGFEVSDKIAFRHILTGNTVNWLSWNLTYHKWNTKQTVKACYNVPPFLENDVTNVLPVLRSGNCLVQTAAFCWS